MKVLVTEYLQIDLACESWECRRCQAALAPARENYKTGLLVFARDPAEIHRPLLDPTQYPFTFAPQAAYCQILEFYCPSCGVLVETEYTVPGHPPVHDIEFDIDALKQQWAERPQQAEPAEAPDHPRPHAHHHHHR